MMKVLIVSVNSLTTSPTGPAYIAGAALRAGHQVDIFECLFAQDVHKELKTRIEHFQPDVIGVSIRLVHAYIIDNTAPYNTCHWDLRQSVRDVINTIRHATCAPIILGGPGFNYYTRDWLEYLQLDYGIRREADFSFPLYLERLEHGGSLPNIPGCVFRHDGQIHKVHHDHVKNLDETALPAFRRAESLRRDQLRLSRATRSFMKNLIRDLRSTKGYSVQVNQPYAGYQWTTVDNPSFFVRRKNRMNQTIEQDPSGVQPIARKFPIEGTNLARILSDPQHRRSFHAQLKRYNPLMVILYRIGLLSLFGVSRMVMLLITKGNKSGKLRITPIGYWRIGGVIHLFSAWGKGASWYKNILANPNDVCVQIGLRRFPVRAQALQAPSDIRCTLERFVNESPDQAHYLFGWEPDRDQTESADFSEIIDRVLVVRFMEKEHK